MKTILPSFLLLAVILASGCVNDKKVAPTPAPAGNFAGQFRLLHKKKNAPGYDTLKATLNLALDATTGFKITGDTATVHAGSFGTYATSQNNFIQFIDKTFPTTGTPTKTHLSGIYQYFYNGDVFQVVGYGALDTLIYQYDLKKTP